MATSIINRDDPGTKWYLLYLDFATSAYGAFPSGSNVAQSKAFTFSKAISWAAVVPTALVQNDAIEAHVVPVSNTVGRVSTRNLTSSSVAATTARLYILVQDPTITVSWS